MISYFDTSALIPLLVEEAGSQRAELLWNESERVVGTRLAYADARAALALAKRIDRITASSLRAAVNDLEHLYAGMSIVEISEDMCTEPGRWPKVTRSGGTTPYTWLPLKRSPMRTSSWLRATSGSAQLPHRSG